MKIVGRVLFAVVLLGILAGWGYLWQWTRTSDEGGPTYSLIEDGLYLGGDVKEPPPGTRVVINLCEKPDAYRVEMAIWESIPDTAPAPDLAWLRRMVETVDRKRSAGLTTYIHCRNGVSRSGMLVVAYEMYKHHWSRDQALKFVRSKRAIVRPNPAFMERLSEWEKALQAPTGEERTPAITDKP